MPHSSSDNPIGRRPEDSTNRKTHGSGIDNRGFPARGIWWIRVASLTPVILIVMAWLFSSSVRDTCGQGIHLLWQGDLPGIRQWAADIGSWAPIVTGVLMVVQGIAAPIPAVMVTAANSFLFGPFWGGLYSILTANIAAAICYGIGRGYGTIIVDSLVSRSTVDRYSSFFQEHGMLTIIVARLIPFVPFDPISYIGGMVRMPFWKFFWATMIGQFPAGMAYSYLIQGVVRPDLFLVSTICIVVALLLTGLLLQRTWFSKSEGSNPAENRDAK